MASQDSDLPEQKLLVDAVQSSKFITKEKSEELIKKLEDLTSRDNAKQLHRQVFIYNRIKADNDAIYTNVDAMSEEEQFALLATDGMIVKRPLLVGEDFVFTGFKEAEWEEKLLK